MGQICFENAKRDEFYGFYESWGSPDVGSPCIFLRRIGGNYRANPHLRILRLLPRSLAPIPAADHTYLWICRRPATGCCLSSPRRKGCSNVSRGIEPPHQSSPRQYTSDWIACFGVGTVQGMVVAFSKIESIQGTVKPSDLAGGIWEALLTTVFGLLVAIPCMALYHAFEGHADKIARRMEMAVTSLDDLLSPSSPSTVTTKPRQRGQEEEFSTVQ